MRCGVYRIVNRDSGKFYIGSSKYLHERKSEHFRLLRQNKHHCIHLQRAYNKEPEAFVFEVLIACDESFQLFYEQLCIDGLLPQYNTGRSATAPWLGVKGASAPRSIPVIELESKKVFVSIREAASIYKCSEALIHRSCNGLAKTAKGKQFAYLSDYEKEGFVRDDPVLLHTGSNHYLARPVIELSSGRTFETTTSAAAFYNVRSQNITKVCQGKRKTTGGYKFAYAT